MEYCEVRGHDAPQIRFAPGEYRRPSVMGQASVPGAGSAPARVQVRLGSGRSDAVHDARPSQSQDVLCVRLFHILLLMRALQRTNENDGTFS